MKKKYAIVILGLIVSFIVSFIWVGIKKNNLRENFVSQINRVIGSKTEISDGRNDIMYMHTEILDSKTDKNVIDVIPTQNNNKASIVSTPSFKGFEYLILRRISSKKNNFEFVLDSMVSNYLVYYGNDIKSIQKLNQGTRNVIFVNITTQCYNSIIDKNIASNRNGRFEDISNFSKISNEYYSFEDSKIINSSASGRKFSQWFDIKKYRLYFSNHPIQFKEKLNKNQILKDYIKFFAISILCYTLILIMFSLINKILKKKLA